MKDISQIISLIKSQRNFVKLNSSEGFDKILKQLPPNISNGVDFLFVKNDILFFVLKHQIYKVECEYNRVTIKNLLTLVQEIKASRVEFIVTNKKPQVIQKVQKLATYEEKSDGEFENYFEDIKMQEIFEKIRSQIKIINNN